MYTLQKDQKSFVLPKPISGTKIEKSPLTTTTSIKALPKWKPTGNALIDVVNKIKELIYAKQPEFVITFLDLLKLEKFKVEDRINILISLLSSAVESKADSTILSIILNKWGEETNEYEGVLSDLASIVYFPPHYFSYILKTMEDISIESILFEAIKTDDTFVKPPAFSIIYDRVVSGCGRQFKIEELERLLAGSVNYKREDASIYLREKIKETEVIIAPKPKWMRYDPNIHTLQEIKKCLFFYSKADGYNTMDNYNHYVSHVYTYVKFDMDHPILDKFPKKKEETKSLEVSSLDDTEIPQNKDLTEDIITPEMVLHDYFAMSSTSDRRHLFHQLKCKNQSKHHSICPYDHYPERKLINPDLLYGPTNSILDIECLSSKSLPGGCRMLTCNCRCLDDGENDDNDNDCEISQKSPYEWFTHFCDTCSIKIGHYSQSLRFPIADGGWVGTYCSLSCIYKFPPRPLYRIDTYRLQLLRDHCNTTGILDWSVLDLIEIK
jgi:hypothetical protein